MTDVSAPPSETLRRTVVLAAADLMERDGLDAMSTRAVAAHAGVRPPTIFRLFGDKDGLLEAVAEHGFETYLRDKTELQRTDDPVEDLRAAWDLHVQFGIAQPAYYALVFGLPRPGHLSGAGRRAVEQLQRMVTRVADAGRLRMSVERATAVLHAAGQGATISLISTPPRLRDPELASVAREMVMSALTLPPTGSTEGGAPGAGDVAGRAMALRVALAREGSPALSAGEQALLDEWLNRLADTPAAPPTGP